MNTLKEDIKNIKASLLNCVSSVDCENCTYYEPYEASRCNDMKLHAVNVIERQQEYILQLETRLKEYEDIWHQLTDRVYVVSTEEIETILKKEKKDEVRHGYWKKVELLGYEPMYECSLCEKLHDQDYNYCDNCGAKMDGKEE